ncbi:MAG: hypothetical protein COV34_00010, partial [Candidatus Zambryskibacteria bacterium CG10_big_fil_rev_8_21_14_0_10_42_12]
MNPDASKKVADFFSQFRKQTYKKGELLIRADDAPSGIYYLTSGNVRKYAISQKGEEVVLNVFKKGAFFPMSFAFNKTRKNDYYYEAMEELTLYKAPIDEVITFLKKDTDVLYDLTTRVFRGTEGLEKRLAYLMAGSAYTRLVTELLIHAKRFGKQRDKGVEIQASETEFAALTGMTRETVSREIRHLKEKRLVSLKKNKLFIEDF